MVVCFATVFVLSYGLFWVIKKTVGLRVSERHEIDGLDISEHGMWGYPEQFMPVPGGAYIHPDAVAERDRRVAPVDDDPGEEKFDEEGGGRSSGRTGCSRSRTPSTRSGCPG